MKKDVIIIGAGASGLFCAMEAGKRGKTVLIIDHSRKVGSKIQISGGGRCNFTNLHMSPDRYISQNPHFCKSALSRYTPEDFISLLKKQRIAFHEKEAGQLFCDTTSAGIIEMLKSECRTAGVDFLMGCRVSTITRSGSFIVETDKGVFQSESLVIATGGISYPKLGATNFGHVIAKQFGLKIIPPKPGLVPLTLSRKDLMIWKDLSGISFNADVSSGSISFQGGVLFTHRGLSGPAILQISSHWKKGNAITIDLLPSVDAYELLMTNRSSRKEMHTMLSLYLPSRFIQAWCRQYLPSKPICQFTEKELKETAGKIHAWQISPSDTEGYATAEVTVGGIDTNEVSSKTMESKKVAGLYFIGEVLDVTGQLGGYNLHWAWASGHAAGQYV